jgi:hypothetical protein
MSGSHLGKRWGAPRKWGSRVAGEGLHFCPKLPHLLHSGLLRQVRLWRKQEATEAVRGPNSCLTPKRGRSYSRIPSVPSRWVGVGQRDSQLLAWMDYPPPSCHTVRCYPSQVKGEDVGETEEKGKDMSQRNRPWK